MAGSAGKLTWEGRWDQLEGKAKQAFGDLTDDDLAVAEGSDDALVGRIEERTGQAEEEFRRALDEA